MRTALLDYMYVVRVSYELSQWTEHANRVTRRAATKKKHESNTVPRTIDVQIIKFAFTLGCAMCMKLINIGI